MRSFPDEIRQFFAGKRVLVTGHTGLKGSWLALWLHRCGADVLGLALPPTSPLSNFSSTNLGSLIKSKFCDVRDFPAMRSAFDEFEPEVVFHLAAQAIVGVAFEDPRTTFDTNVLGTVNVLECVRAARSVRVAVMITSDKCYENVEQIWGYREPDLLGGTDPYSASKACAEHAIRAYTESFFREPGRPAVASTRAGNVVGGGDWSPFRLVPDCIRSLRKGEAIVLRNPEATRPWQFVLDPLAGYMLLGMRLWQEGRKFSGAWNFGPAADNTNTVERGAREIVARWGSGSVEVKRTTPFQEHSLLQLDCSKARELLAWRPQLDFRRTMELTADWYKAQRESGDKDMLEVSSGQLRQFEDLMTATGPRP